MPYFAYIVGGWVQKEGKFCLRNKSMAPKSKSEVLSYISFLEVINDTICQNHQYL